MPLKLIMLFTEVIQTPIRIGPGKNRKDMKDHPVGFPILLPATLKDFQAIRERAHLVLNIQIAPNSVQMGMDIAQTAKTIKYWPIALQKIMKKMIKIS